MNLYRLCQHKYINDLSGEGARLYGGRWNEKGFSTIYTSNALSLSFLEILCHIKPMLIKDKFSVLILEYNTDKYAIEKINFIDLEKNWMEYPANRNSISIGSKWLKSFSSVGLNVPTAAIPIPNDDEFNVILNPLHPDFYKAVSIKKIIPFSFDERFNKL